MVTKSVGDRGLLHTVVLLVLMTGCGSAQGGLSASPEISSNAKVDVEWPGEAPVALDEPFTIAGDTIDRPKSIPTVSPDRAWSTYLAGFASDSSDYDAVPTTKRRMVFVSFTAADGTGHIDKDGHTIDRVVERPALALITTGVPCKRYGPLPPPGVTRPTIPENIGAKNVVLFDATTGALLLNSEQCGFPR
jgi:hypothetical protein